MTKADLAIILKSYPVLEEVPSSLLQELQREAVPVRAPAGRQLFSEGSPCTHFPLLVDGVIRALKCGPDGHEMLLYRLHPGETCVITVTALLGGSSYPAMAAAETDLAFFGVPRKLFLDLILQAEPFRKFVFQFLSSRMTHLMALIDDVAFRRLDQRLAARLLLLGDEITLTHQKLADELGTTRECVSRTLESMQDLGFLRLGRKKIEILDRGALTRLHRADVG
ncbi:MAG: Crp/Fnr family transcriptional regulator [Candidatus Polarisedimenticolia bacterium]